MTLILKGQLKLKQKNKLSTSKPLYSRYIEGIDCLHCLNFGVNWDDGDDPKQFYYYMHTENTYMYSLLHSIQAIRNVLIILNYIRCFHVIYQT